MQTQSKYQELIEEFPRLYRAVSENSEPFGYWGFQCGEGWYPLLRQLSADIDSVVRDNGIDPLSDAWPRAAQVKEKFGCLRIYLSWPQPVTEALSSAVHHLVQTAQTQSSTICEDCGVPGQLRKGPWIHTKCDHCEAKFNKEKSEWDFSKSMI